MKILKLIFSVFFLLLVFLVLFSFLPALTQKSYAVNYCGYGGCYIYEPDGSTYWCTTAQLRNPSNSMCGANVKILSSCPADSALCYATTTTSWETNCGGGSASFCDAIVGNPHGGYTQFGPTTCVVEKYTPAGSHGNPACGCPYETYGGNCSTGDFCNTDLNPIPHALVPGFCDCHTSSTQYKVCCDASAGKSVACHNNGYDPSVWHDGVCSGIMVRMNRNIAADCVCPATDPNGLPNGSVCYQGTGGGHYDSHQVCTTDSHYPTSIAEDDAVCQATFCHDALPTVTTTSSGASCNATGSQITFSWSGNNNPTKYTLYYCDKTATPACGTYASVNEGKNTSATINITQGHTYQWYVVENNCRGTSTSSVNTQTCTFNISGNVYKDKLRNGVRDADDPNYTGPISVSINSANATVAYPSAGSYKISNILLGSGYTVTYNMSAAGGAGTLGYLAINPKPPSYFNITLPCSGTTNCSNGDILNLNFGISNSAQWVQSVGGDMYGNPFSDTIPITAETNSPPVPYGGGGPYASVFGTGLTPGIVYSGGANASFSPTGSTGYASASSPPFGWVANNTNYSPSGPFSTSFANIDALIDQFGKRGAVKGLSTVCGNVANCDLSSASSGIYYSYSPVGLTTSTIKNNTNIIILVGRRTGPGGSWLPVTTKTDSSTVITPQDLTIKGKVLVANGSTLLITVSGSIYVDKAVGEPANTYCTVPQGTNAFSTGCDLEGYFSSDGSFTLKGNTSPIVCPTNDLRFNLGGSMVVNALGKGGSLNYTQRDLCNDGSTYPVFSITERPDFVLYAPDIFKTQRRVWQEVAP